MKIFSAPKSTDKDAVIGGVGAALGMAITWLLCDWLLDSTAPILVMSMGASAVLLFATPTSPLAQPGPVIVAHTLGAVFGVAAATWIDNAALAVAIAVGLTAGVIIRFGITHPPSGGTALSAVVGGEAITKLGWEFIWRPVLLNAVVLVVLAVLVNAPFAWRRYPVRT
ncbi:MAG: HPP family protein [Actinomycetota bacterium]